MDRMGTLVGERTTDARVEVAQKGPTQLASSINRVSANVEQINQMANFLHDMCDILGLPYPSQKAADGINGTDTRDAVGLLGELETSVDRLTTQRENLSIAVSRIAQIVGK